MRVGIIAEVFLPKIDGVVNRTLNLVRRLNQRGDNLFIVCPLADGCNDCSAPVFPVPSFSFPLYPEYRIGLPDRRLVTGIEQFAPDVLHYVNPFAFGFRCYDVLYRAGMRIPTVFSFHTLYGEFVKRYAALKPLSKVLWWMMREYHNRADVNITVSATMQEELVRRGFRRVRCWPPAVDSTLFQPAPAQSAMRDRLTGGRPERPLLLTVSRLAPEKNVALLTDVLDRLPGVCLAVVGDGPQRGELESLFATRDARFFGYLTGRDLADAYAAADAFVYASETETMGNVVLEAMACGCLVVAPRAGGIPDLVSHGETGMLYEPGDGAGAATLCQQALNDPGLRIRLGQSARETVLTWSWENSVDRVRQFYCEAVEGHRPAAVKATLGQKSACAVTTALVAAFRTRAAIGRGGRRIRAASSLRARRG